MALFSRLRLSSLTRRHRSFSTILNPDSSTPLTAKQKSRAAISLLKSEKSPERILEICRAASLTPEYHLDRIAYSTAISKLSESNYFDGIRQFLEESKTRPDLKNERFLCHAIVLYGQAGMIQEAINTFKQSEELGVCRSVKSLNSLLFACILAKDIKELKRIYIDFPKIYGIQPDLDTYNYVIKAFGESGSASSVYSVFTEMDKAGIKPNATTFGNMLSGFYKEEKFEDVGKVLKLMEDYNIPRGLGIFNIRIQSLCKLKKSDEAKQLFDAMLLRGMKPNLVTYNHLILGFCKEGKYDEAKKIFKSMADRGFRPHSQCYFTVIHYLCKGEDFEAALSIYKECAAKGWVPYFATMKSLVNGLASSGKVEEARELISQVKEKVSKNLELWEEVEASLPQ